ncbi:MAG: flap endonuclease-1 [Desulfurococcaceae archaeon]
MGVNIRELISDDVRRQIDDLRQLRGQVIAIDGYNALYQFLTAIRQPDGTPLMDTSGRITSHLSGLFYRTINLMENGIKPLYVFDGKPPEIKAEEIARRKKIREDASRKYEESIKKGDLESARRYAMMSAKLTDEMVNDAKKLLEAMGLPYVQAPAEGEAQAAYIVRKGDAYASASQDYDSLLFGSTRLIRNLTISGRRKLPGREEYEEVKPEIIELNLLLNKLGITREQLIDLAILIGTDYNPDGIPNIGVKTAYQLIKQYKSLEKIPKTYLAGESIDELIKIRQYFLTPPITINYRIDWREPDVNEIKRILVEEHDFNSERVSNACERLVKAYREFFKSKQMGLETWFKKN